MKAETKFSFNVFSGKDCEFVKPFLHQYYTYGGMSL